MEGFFGFFSWWGGLTPALRFGVAFLLIGIAVLFFFLKFGLGFWLSPGIAGVILLFAAFPTRGERKGYHDF